MCRYLGFFIINYLFCFIFFFKGQIVNVKLDRNWEIEYLIITLNVGKVGGESRCRVDFVTFRIYVSPVCPRPFRVNISLTYMTAQRVKRLG